MSGRRAKRQRRAHHAEQAVALYDLLEVEKLDARATGARMRNARAGMWWRSQNKAWGSPIQGTYDVQPAASARRPSCP